MALQAIGGYMAFILVFGWLRGWHRGPSSISMHAPKPRRQVVRLDRNTFKVVG
jgi:hypothetical protein